MEIRFISGMVSGSTFSVDWDFLLGSSAFRCRGLFSASDCFLWLELDLLETLLWEL